MSSDGTFQCWCKYCGLESSVPVCAKCYIALGHGASMVPLPPTQKCLGCDKQIPTFEGQWINPWCDSCMPCFTAPLHEFRPENPKDLIGSNKIPLHLWPETASVMGSLALLHGALKYGRNNWRAVGIRASVYYDATRRHLNAWFEGEDLDPDSGLPHLAHALASIAILIDGQAKMEDDRNLPSNYLELVKAMTPQVKAVKDKVSDKPRHYTIKDKTQ